METETILYAVIVVLAFISLCLLVILGKQSSKIKRKRLAYPKVEPEVEKQAEIDSVLVAELNNQLAMLEEFDGIVRSDLSEEQRLALVQGRIAFYRRKITFSFDK